MCKISNLWKVNHQVEFDSAMQKICKKNICKCIYKCISKCNSRIIFWKDIALNRPYSVMKQIVNFYYFSNPYIKSLQNSYWTLQFVSYRDCCKKSRLIFFYIVVFILMILLFCVCILKVDTLRIPKW